MQLAAANDWVTVNWPKVQHDVRRALGTGTEAMQSTQTRERVTHVLAYNLPTGTGFASGLAFALGGRIVKLGVVASAAAASLPLAYADNDSRVRETICSHAPWAAEVIQTTLLTAMAHVEAARWAHSSPAALAKEEARLRKELRALTAGGTREAPNALRIRAKLLAIEASAGRKET